MQDLVLSEGQELIQAPQAANRSIVAALDDVGLNEQAIAKELKHIIDDAETSTPKGDIIEDYGTKLQAINTWHKMRKSSPDIAINIANIFSGQDAL